MGLNASFFVVVVVFSLTFATLFSVYVVFVKPILLLLNGVIPLNNNEVGLTSINTFYDSLKKMCSDECGDSL